MGSGGTPGFCEIDGARDPRDPSGKRTVTLRIARFTVDNLFKSRPEKAFNLVTAVEVLRSPERIYRWFWREDPEGVSCWCYVGRPARIREGPLSWSSRPRGTVFLVLVDSLMNVEDWRREKADPEDPAAPSRDAIELGGLAWVKR